MKEEVVGVFGKFRLESAHKYQNVTLVINTFLIYLVYVAAYFIQFFLTCKALFVLSILFTVIYKLFLEVHRDKPVLRMITVRIS